MPAAKGEHDIKSINELFIDKKDQSNLNRFLTKSQWNLQAVTQTGSHDYVTSLYVNNGVAASEGLKLYDNEKKCKQKG